MSYFTELLHLKLRPRLASPQAVEDVRQETFTRVLATLRKDGTLRQPERLGVFVNSVCNNVLLEHYRSSSRHQPIESDEQPDLPDTSKDALDTVASKQMEDRVREILLKMPERDRSLLKAIFLDERDRDEVCRELSVDREYLRVLLHRAKLVFKTEFVKQVGDGLRL